MKYALMKKCCPNTYTHIYIYIYIYTTNQKFRTTLDCFFNFIIKVKFAIDL